MDCEIHKVLGDETLLQVIFAKIPLPELLKSTSRVCQHWNRVIHGEGFLPFKKSFYKVINKDEDAIVEICRNLQNDLKDWNPGYPIDCTYEDEEGNLELENLERSLPYLLKKFSCHPKLTLLKLPDECLQRVNKHKR